MKMTCSELLARLFVFLSAVVMSVVLIRIVARPGLAMDFELSALAALSLFLSSGTAGFSLLSGKDRSFALGACVGLPFGFFCLQRSYGIEMGNVALAQGAGNVLAYAGAIGAAVSVSTWLVRRRSIWMRSTQS